LNASGKILLLGATGRTGKLVLKEALEKGYKLNCLARNSSRINTHPNLTLFEGNPTNKEDLEHAMVDCQSVISVLNISRNSDYPWAKLRTPEQFLSNTMQQLIPIAEEKKLARLIVCSAWGVGDSRNDIPNWFKWFINNSNLGAAYKDHELQEELVASSKLNWTIVRPVGLKNSTKEEVIQETYNNIPKPSIMISRLSVAKFLINSLSSEKLVGKKVIISKAF